MLPADLPVTPDDVRALQFTVSARGYRMTEVDWLLDLLAAVLEERDEQIAALRAQLHPAPTDARKSGRTPPESDDEEHPDA